MAFRSDNFELAARKSIRGISKPRGNVNRNIYGTRAQTTRIRLWIKTQT